MRKYLLHVLIISFVFLVTPTVSFADAEAKRIYKENNNAVVMVTAYDEEGDEICIGSGFHCKTGRGSGNKLPCHRHGERY